LEVDELFPLPIVTVTVIVEKYNGIIWCSQNYGRYVTVPPSWLANPRTVLVKRHVREIKYYRAGQISLKRYVFIRFENGHEATISIFERSCFIPILSVKHESKYSESIHTDNAPCYEPNSIVR